MRTTPLFVSALVVSLAAFACSSTSEDDVVSATDAGADGASADAAGDGGSISGSTYSQSCTVDTDCTLIHEGNVCEPCLNQNAAINVSDRSKYDSDFTALRNTCGPMPAIACIAVINRKPVCQASKCASVPIEEDAGTDAAANDDASTADASDDAK